MFDLFYLFGVIGILFITAGIIVRNRKHQYIFHIIGGLSLEAYSIYIGDVIFIVLQAIFVLVAFYELVLIFHQKTLQKT
jgi:lipid-A-disaccharide synthase-like uncharacterized protein